MALTPLKQRPATAYRRIPVPPGSILLVPNRETEPSPEPEPPPFPDPIAQWDVNTRGRVTNDLWEHVNSTGEISQGGPLVVVGQDDYHALQFEGTHYTLVNYAASNLNQDTAKSNFTIAMRLSQDAFVDVVSWWAGFEDSPTPDNRIGINTTGDLDTKASWVDGVNSVFLNPDPDAPQDGSESVVTFVREGSELRLYKEGVEVVGGTYTLGDMNADGFGIGAQQIQNTPQGLMRGKVFWVAVWDQALSVAEIAELDAVANPFAAAPAEPPVNPPDPPIPGNEIFFEDFNTVPNPIPNIRDDLTVWVTADRGNMEWRGHHDSYYTPRVVAENTIVPPGGTQSIKFELPGGNSPGQPADPNTAYYRSEITTRGYQRGSPNWDGINHRIEYDMYLENYPIGDSVGANRTVLFQIHQDSNDEPGIADWSPVFCVRARASDGALVITQSRSTVAAPADVLCSQDINDINNKWVRVKWEWLCTAAANGYIRLYFDDVLVGEYNGQTWEPQSLKFGYYKVGIYAGWHRNVDGANGRKVMYIDNFQVLDISS